MSDFTMSHHASKDDMLKAVMAENEGLKAQLAAAQQWAQDAEPAAWVATFKPEGLLALHSVVGANLEELKQSVPGNSVFRPLYTHPATQGLDAQAIERAAQKLAEIAEYNWAQLTEKQREEFRTDALSALTAALGLGHE